MTVKPELQEQLDYASSLLQSGRVTDAHSLVKAVVDAIPDHVDALYILAVCQRLMKI